MARANAVMDAPPPRYRVVERDRRLEVIDIGTGRPLRPSPGPTPGAKQRTPLWPRRTRFDGSAQIVTRTFYDDKAPRTLQLDPGRAAIVQWVRIGAAAVLTAYAALVVWQPWALGLVPLLFRKSLWKKLRAPVTRWLDRVERETG